MVIAVCEYRRGNEKITHRGGEYDVMGITRRGGQYDVAGITHGGGEYDVVGITHGGGEYDRWEGVAYATLFYI